MPARRMRLSRMGLAGAGLLAFAGAGLADEARQVVLRMRGGDFQVTGELRSYDGTRYVIESPQLGRLTLQANRFDCVGAACTSPVASATWGAEPLSADRPETIAVRGPETIGTLLMPALIRGFATSVGAQVIQIVGTTPGELRYRLADARGAELAVIDLQAATAEAGLDSLKGGTAAIAMADRVAREAEIASLGAAEAGKKPGGQHEYMIGADGIAIVVSPDNPASGLALDALARIFSGQVTDWFELGLPPGKIVLHGRTQPTGASERFAELVLQPRGVQLAPPTQLAASESELTDAVARDRNGIAVVSFAAVRSAKSLNIESACGLVHRPTTFAVKSDEYPLSQRLYLYAPVPPRQTVARALLSYATSREAQRIIADSQFISQTIEMVGLDGQAERMATALNAPTEAFDLPQMRAMLADLKGGRRLSVTFRFAPGTLDLDARSRLEVAHLAGLLLTPEFSAKRVLLAGYTDSTGGKFQANLNHSFKRAAQIRTALLAAGGKQIDQRLITAKGFGPLAPVACNDTAEGQRLNRRVEVWVRD